MLRIRLSSVVLLICSLIVLSLPAVGGTSVRKLPPNYRHWIEAEVPYIISSEERKQFLSLTTDEERDSFITAFWKLRNPDPNSETNSYKEEHYRRLAYANDHFGNAKYEDGWRTEMGRMYIILGAPKQTASYHEQANLRPIEIWFYEAETPALPPYFYILFFKHTAAEAWRIYSPTQDTPVALVTTGESQNDPKMALRFIRKSAGDEVAKTTLTLVPTESADFDNFAPSMESDMMLATINGLPDNELTKRKLEANRLREHVTMSVLTGDAGAGLGYDVIRDDQGRETLSYILRMPHPDARLLGTRADGTPFYDLSLRTSVATPDGKSVYDQEDPLTGTLTDAQAEIAKKKRFAAEGRLPLAPGKYLLEATLTNNLNHIAIKKRLAVDLPVLKSGDLALSPLLAYAAPAAVPDPQGRLPFSFSKIRFTPRGAQTMELRQGDQLPLVFQLWVDPKTVTPAEKVHLRYVFGAVTASHEKPAEENEDVEVSNPDPAGNFLTGRKLDTSPLMPGTYRLVVSATREGEHRSAFASMNLTVEPAADFVDTWTAYGPSDPAGEAVDDLKRGLSAEASGADLNAETSYRRALQEAPSDIRAIEKLAALLARTGNTDALAALSQQPILMQTAVSPKTLLLIAPALTKNGNPKGVVRMLEAQIKLQPPNPDLYRTLADACEASGDNGRARDLRSLATGLK